MYRVSLKTAAMFSKATDDWRTPHAFFEALDAEFGFDLDVAATKENTWKDNYLGPDHCNPWDRNALVRTWANVNWMNPPYSQCSAFLEKAAEEAHMGHVVVALLPSRTDTRWWHKHVWDAKTNHPRPGVEIRFIKGRLKFGNSTNSAPFPSVVVVFRPTQLDILERTRDAATMATAEDVGPPVPSIGKVNTASLESCSDSELTFLPWGEGEGEG